MEVGVNDHDCFSYRLVPGMVSTSRRLPGALVSAGRIWQPQPAPASEAARRFAGRSRESLSRQNALIHCTPVERW